MNVVFTLFRFASENRLCPGPAAIFVLIIFMFSTAIQAQFCLTWVQRGNAVPVNPAGTPGQRTHHAMAYDSYRGVTVFFGGEIGKTGSEHYFNDTWEYDGTKWRPITIVGDIPPARSLHAMAYDPVRKRVVMYGGYSGGPEGLDDTWEYQGNGLSGTWTLIAPGLGFSGDAGPALVWAPPYGHVLRSAGIISPYSNGNTFDYYAYFWDGSWTQLGGAHFQYPGIWGCGMAFDTYRQVAILVGGWNGSLGTGGTLNPTNHWEFVSQIGWVDTGHYFPGRGFPAMAYDERRHRAVVVGGDNGLAGTGEQVLEFDSMHPERGWMPTASLPSGMGRAGAAMVYDSKRGVMVLMGGAGPGAPNSSDGGRYDDTWELVPTPPPLLIAGPADTDIFCTSEPFSGLRVYSGSSLPLFTYQWMVDGVSLPDQTNYALELPPYSLTAGNHTFTVTATDQCGNPTSTNASYTFHRPPVISGFNVQNALGSDPDPTSLLVTNYQCPGGSVTYSVQMLVDAFSLPTTYQWYHDGFALPGATDTSLQLANLRHEDSGRYYVVASNLCGSTDSSQPSPVYLQVGITIDVQPVDVVAQVCKSASFSVQARGFGPLQYQWRMDGIPIGQDPHFTGATTSQLAINPVLYAHERDYDVVITDNCGAANAVTSHVAQLTVQPGPQWVLRATTGPQARWGDAMAYDSARGVTVLYGGGQSVPNVGYVGFGELWEWNGAHWRQRTTYNQTNAWHKNNNGSWVQNFTDTPAARLQNALAYDSRRRRVVMFGGRSAPPDGGDYTFNDTWEWDGSRWYFRTTNGPVAQFNHHMAYDPIRGVTVVYGGFGASPGVVWEWDGAQWKTNTPGNGPNTYTQDAGAMDFDAFAGHVFFGPATDGRQINFYLYWDGQGWQDAGTGFGVFDTSPPYGAMVFDTYRTRSVFFGGQDNGFYGGTTGAYYNPRHGWSSMPGEVQISQFDERDLSNPLGLDSKLTAHSDLVSEFLWTNFSSTTQSSLLTTDPVGVESALVSALNGVVNGPSIYESNRFAGIALSAETLAFLTINPQGKDIPRFNRLLLEDAYLPMIRRGPSIPTGRWKHAMAFDSARHAAVLMGGVYGNYDNLVGNETWELLDVDLPIINEQPASQYRVPGDTSVFNVTAVGPTGTLLNYDWFFGAIPLNDGGRFSGAHSPSLTIANVTSADAGQYQVRISNDCGTIYSAPAVLTTSLGLQIFSTANSVTLVWSTSNVTLQQADSLLGPWSPVAGAVSPFDIAAQGPQRFYRLVSAGP